MSNTIIQILDKIQENQIFVPAFQREYVWKKKHVKELFRSLINEYPTGTLLTWETNKPPELKGKIKYSAEMGTIKLLLDGQQRITSLYIIIKGENPPYYTDEEIKTDVSYLCINLDSMELEYNKKGGSWFRLTGIFKEDASVTKFIRESDEENFRKRNYNLKKIEKVKDFKFHEQCIPPKADIKDAIDVFYAVNAMGIKLTEAELALAQISGYWPEARQTFKEKLSELNDLGFNFKLDLVIYLLLGIIHFKGDEMSKIHTKDNLEKIKEVWSLLESNILEYTINILKSNYIESTREINSVYALVPFVTYIYLKNGKLDEKETKKLMKWFYFSQIRSRYSGQLGQKLTKDLSLLKHSLEDNQNPFDNLLGVIEEERSLKISENDFEGATVNNPLFNLMKFYFKSEKALSFDGISINAGHGSKYSLENDHIFPTHLLAKKGYRRKTLKFRLANEIANRAIVTKKENRAKSGKDTLSYLTEVQKKHPNALKSQLIPEDRDLWKIENYEKFLKKRRQLLSKKFNSFLENLAETKDNEMRISFSDLIEKGEGESLEFKSTLSWNIKGRVKDKKIEDSVLKTIAGFNNKDGGILLIGVDDKKDILGLDHDYKEAGLESKDKFERHLKNILRDGLGEEEYLARKINISFETIEEKDICIVEVELGDKPIYTKDGKFFLRHGNETREIHPSETHDYISERFDK